MIFELLAVFLSSTIIAYSIYSYLPVDILQKGSAFVLAGLLLYLVKVVFKKGEQKGIGKLKIVVLVFLTSLLVQMVVISTGGFYSALLILVHLYSLSLGFLISFFVGSSFLILTLVILGGQIYWDPLYQQKFSEDPGMVAIYFVSFLIVLPLAQYVTKTYNLKDKMSKALSEHLNIGRQRENSLLTGLNELIFITDKHLNIVSISESAQKMLKLPLDEARYKYFLDQIRIVNGQGLKILAEELPLEEILQDGATRIVDDLYLITPSGTKSPVTVQLKPIKDSEDKVNQIVFIITDARLSLDTKEHHQDLESVLMRYKQTLSNLRMTMTKAKNPQILPLEILAHIEEDLRLALEMEDHPLKESISLEDIAFISREVVENKKDFARKLGVKLQFILPADEIGEQSWLNLKTQNVNPESLGKSDFSAPIDATWLKLLVQKLTDLSLLLTAYEPSSKLDLVVSRQESNLLIQFKVNSGQVTKENINQLFIKDYGQLGVNTNLKLGSGVEGFLAHAIATELKIPLSVQPTSNPNGLILTLNISTSSK